jgi:hypothetical protein
MRRLPNDAEKVDRLKSIIGDYRGAQPQPWSLFDPISDYETSSLSTIFSSFADRRKNRLNMHRERLSDVSSILHRGVRLVRSGLGVNPS